MESTLILSTRNINIGESSLSMELAILLALLFSVSLIFMLLSNIYINHFRSEKYVLTSVITTAGLLFGLVSFNPLSGIMCFFALFFSVISFIGSQNYKNFIGQIGGAIAYYLCMALVLYFVF